MNALHSPSPNPLRTAFNNLAQDAVFIVMVCHDLFSEIEKANTLQEAIPLSVVGKGTTAIHREVIEREIASIASALEIHEAKGERRHD